MIDTADKATIAPGDRQSLRSLVRTFYDIQGLRIQVGNRLCMHFRVQLGQAPGEGDEALSAEARKLLADLREDYGRLADAVARSSVRRWRGLLKESAGIIATPYELALTREYVRLERTELDIKAAVGALLEDFPIWREFMGTTRAPGCGILMAAVIIAEMDPHKAYTVSGFWKFSGLDVGPDGRGRGRYAEHLIDVEYTARDGTTQTKKSLTYNPWLRQKLLGVLAVSFIRAGKEGRYYQEYRNYKTRLENHETYRDTTPMHRERMARRYAVKRFLADLWDEWRTLEGLPIRPDYAQAKLGLVHGGEAAVQEAV